MKEFVLTILADDKPGIVESVSSVVEANGGNWLESRMSQMAGKFAGIVRIACEDDCEKTLTAALEALDNNEIRITVDPGQSPSGVSSIGIAFIVTANDRPGIVKEVSNCLAELNINLEDMHTECNSAPMSSGVVFTASFLAVIPENVALEDVIQSLESLSDDLMVDVDSE